MDKPDLESMAEALEASGEYRVLRLLNPLDHPSAPVDLETRLGLYVDVETTGLDSNVDEIIELAMVPFSYSIDGRVFETHSRFHGLRQPRYPLSALVTSLTGITDEMLAGKEIDRADVATFVERSSVIVAHNAAFDRRFLEHFADAFKERPWACSMTQIDWRAEGFEGTKLAYLAMESGFFYKKHRAVEDCLAGIELLRRKLPKSCEIGMGRLLENARRSSWRIWALNSPFESKDLLKARGYRWSSEGAGYPRSWFIDVPEGDRDRELAFLQTSVFGRQVELPVQRITAYERFSNRI